MEEIKMIPKRVRDEAEPLELDVDSPAVKRSRESLFDGLDYDLEICAWNEDLNSFLKSFEDEITVSPSVAAAAGGGLEAVVDVATDLGKSPPDLGYLLEASDEELGIPPPTTSFSAELTTEFIRVESESSQFGNELCEVADYGGLDSGSGIGGREDYNGEYEGLGSLFNYSDLGIGSGDYSWRPATLPAQ